MADDMTRPNILLLFSDQHRADAMGCAGHPVVQTPNLDRLAAQGTRFANGYCATPLCHPSRVSLATGRWPHNTGTATNSEGYLHPATPMISHALRDAGYRTALLGKLHLRHGARAGSPECDRWLAAAGYDDFMPVHGKAWSCVFEEPDFDAHLRYLSTTGKLEAFRRDYRERNFAGWMFPDVEPRPKGYAAPSPLDPHEHQDGFITRKACEWIEQADDDRPFFCWVNWGGPHDPWDAPGRFGTMYDPAAMPPPIPDSLEGAPAKLREHSAKYMTGMPAEAWRDVKAQYYGSISFIDDGVGQILAALDRRGLADSTVVVYASDHGEMMFDHNMLTKWVMYEASAQVPLIVRAPGGAAGRTVEAPISLLDLAPTLLDLAGVDRSAMGVLHGESLAGELAGGPERADRAVFCEMHHTKMIRRGRWKYSTDPRYEVDQLFDLEEDPDELVNLAGRPEHAERVARFRDELLRWMIETQNVPLPRGIEE